MMEKAEKNRIHFDRNGVASIDTAELMRLPEVRRQYELGRKIVDAHRMKERARRKSKQRAHR